MTAYVSIPQIQFIVLDIDGTLIDGNTPETIVERPYLDIFLRTLFFLFQGRVALWTAATWEWLDLVSRRHLIPKIPKEFRGFAFMLWRDHCVRQVTTKPLVGQVQTYLKPLRLLPSHVRGRISNMPSPTLENTIIVDDTPETFLENPDKAIFIERFYKFNLSRELQDRTLIRTISTIRDLMTSPHLQVTFPLNSNTQQSKTNDEGVEGEKERMP